MIGQWSLHFIVTLALAAALGNVLALGLYSFTWWLRQRALLLTAILGAIALLIYSFGVGFLCIASAQGSLFFDGPPPPDNWRIQAIISSIKTFTLSFIVISLVGALQMRQIPTRWLVASLCFCFEIAIAVLVWQLVVAFLHTNTWAQAGYNFSESKVIRNIFGYFFGLTLVTLALSRPLWLRVHKSVHNMLNSVSG